MPFLLPCFLPPESSKPVMHAALRLQKHEEFMSRFVLCSLLNGPFGLRSTAEQWMGIFRELSALTMGSLLPAATVRTACCFLGIVRTAFPLLKHYFADQHWPTPHLLHAQLALVKSFCNYCHRFSLRPGWATQLYQQFCHTTIRSFPHHLRMCWVVQLHVGLLIISCSVKHNQPLLPLVFKLLTSY